MASFDFGKGKQFTFCCGVVPADYLYRPEFIRKIQTRPGTGDYSSLKYIAKLTDIAGPLVVDQGFHGSGRDFLNMFAEFFVEHRNEMFGQERNVILPVAQRR